MLKYVKKIYAGIHIQFSLHFVPPTFKNNLQTTILPLQSLKQKIAIAEMLINFFAIHTSSKLSFSIFLSPICNKEYQ